METTEVKSGRPPGIHRKPSGGECFALPAAAWRHTTIGVALGLTVGIGALEYATGYDFHLTAFFLVPICWAAWVAGRRAGLLVALVSAGDWLAADVLTGHPYKHPAIPYWNGLMLLAFFVVIVYLLCAVQQTHRSLVAAQHRLQNQNEWLEATVRQRTAALETEIGGRKRLEQAKLQAERLAMVGTIAAQVAHEVRNPLGSMTLNLDLLAKEIKHGAGAGEPAPEGQVLITEMRAEVRRIQQVLEAYLRLARLPKLEEEPVRLNALLAQKLGFMAPAFQKAGVRLVTDFDVRLKSVPADAEQLWQALLNLLRNSLEATPAGGEVLLRTRLAEPEAVVSLCDSGRGMNREQLNQMFVPFFTTKPRGTGLGLPLVQHILQGHGARIECASAEGKGTAFTIYLPLRRPARSGG